MATLETRMLSHFGGQPENYLYDYCRRYNHLDHMKDFEVHVSEDVQGRQWASVVEKVDPPPVEPPVEPPAPEPAPAPTEQPVEPPAPEQAAG